jgi:NAD(P)-dependent dehydrogenase (short-subunit alcohol dehydrogenase family)
MNQSVAVVTGASRGLGRGIARALGASGFTVYVTGRNTAELDQAVAEVNAKGGRGVAVPCDHHDDEQVKAVFEQIRSDAGRLDLLVNNAAMVDVPASMIGLMPSV